MEDRLGLGNRRFPFPQPAHSRGYAPIYENAQDPDDGLDGAPEGRGAGVSWRPILGTIVVTLLAVEAIQYFGASFPSVLRTPVNLTVKSLFPGGQNKSKLDSIDGLTFPFPLPESLPSDQLEQLQVSIVKFIEDRLTSATLDCQLHHDELIQRQGDLYELRNTYQIMAKQFNQLKEFYRSELEKKDNELRAEKDKYAIATEAQNAEIKRMRTLHDDVVQYMDNRKRREENLNETVRQEVLRIFEEVSSPNPSSERSGTLRMWLLRTFVLSGDLHSELRQWTKNLRRELEKIVLDGITAGGAKDIAREAYEKFLSDQTGLYDFALKAVGAEVLSTRDTEPTELSAGSFAFASRSPQRLPVDIILTPGYLPGQCWPFRGFPGSIVIQLAARLDISSFGMDYMPRRMSPTGKLLPAPRHFEVFGLEALHDSNPFLFGSYEYMADSDENIQIFPVQFRPSSNQEYEIVELRILSNHGSPDYTAVCRFRIHGNVTDAAKRCSLGF